MKLRHDGFISSFIDTLVVHIGGTTLRLYHRLERWLFVITSIGAFFMIAIWLNACLFPTLITLDQSVDTFEELAEINPPIYLVLILNGIEGIVLEMLRFISISLSFIP